MRTRPGFTSEECWKDIVTLLKGSSVVSAHLEQRVSLKLLVYCVAVVMSVFLIFVSGSTAEMVVYVASAAAWGIAAYRAVRRLYVLVMEIEPLGTCVMPGFTNAEARYLAYLLTELKKTQKRTPPRRG